LPIGIGLSDYVDALIDPAHPDAIGALVNTMAELGDWQECHLPDLPPGAALADAACPARVNEARDTTVPCPVLEQIPVNLHHSHHGAGKRCIPVG
jgi:hypothetical protein